ncbi:M1 family metallopeptidase [Nocardioides sp. GY 10113]|uniref:M1 family metallopeptidase n=1 Tax=Nocardioides sp. GY 10113 TaxID=2569761 RepID=UPI0010A79149|nr:M1 family metallopeptidase [Nocardioides sp. GY 10113]TIC84977.1 M1 family metallopeptidase [Nocardioides sp. GY 10113]
MSNPRTPRRGRAVAGTALALALAGCNLGDDAARPLGEVPPSGGASTATPGDGTGTAPTAPEDLDVAVSETRTDSVYPDAGDPLVDALHYDLDLTWSPDRDRLDAREILTFRATANAPGIRLDLSDALTVGSVAVDGEPADFALADQDLTIDHRVRRDRTYELVIEYGGSPEPVPAPSVRDDFADGLGWLTAADHSTSTLQEPYGAFTWYAVNDHPSDKALYDFTLTTDAPWTGVANGENTGTTEEDGLRTTTWHLAEPAASYLVTVAFDDFQVTDLASPSGVPIQIWAPAEGDPTPGQTGYAPQAMAWLEELLGPYPFDTFGIVVVGRDSGMETQTMVTLGNTPYTTSAAVVVHELAHQWYGDTVTPADWSDVWMNEGTAMYLQGLWQAEQAGISIEEKIDSWARGEAAERAEAGPPGAYDPEQFGAGNIYYGPALMWQELRERIGDEAFFALLRDWPADQENDTADRREYLRWIERETGEELTAFFGDWLLSPTTPDRDDTGSDDGNGRDGAQYSNAVAGSSMIPATSARNREPVAPSM